MSSKVKESNSKLNEGANIADDMIDLVLGSVLKNVSSKTPEPSIGVHNDQEENNTTDDTPLQELRVLPVLQIDNNGDSLSSPGEMVQNIVHDPLLLNNREIESYNNSCDIASSTSESVSVDGFLKQINKQAKK